MYIANYLDRAQEIENEFELVDLHNKGKLTQNEIISYLNDKYQWVNEYILKDVFNSMHWDQDQAVSKYALLHIENNS